MADRTKQLGVTARVEQTGKLDVNASVENKSSFTRKHFERGTADLLVDEATERIYGVWYCE